MIRLIRIVVLISGFWLAAAPAAATEVDLELVLAIDVSRSVDPDEAQLQRDGYLGALVHPSVVRAIRSGPLGRIGITYFEWAGTAHQRVVIGWTLIDGQAKAEDFVGRLAEAPIGSANWTSISGAIDYAMALFEASPFRGARRVIDVSGDGRNNQGRPAEAARDDAVAQSVTINGLPIVNERINFARPAEADLDIYYRDAVIGGPGAFMIVARSFDSFGHAILNKLIREIAGGTAPDSLAAAP